MCLAIPAEVIELTPSSDAAKVSIGGVVKTISLSLVDNVEPGDYVLVHVGFALNKISEAEAKKTLELFAEANLIEMDYSHEGAAGEGSAGEQAD